MPVLNFDKREKDMPNMNRLQECDRCGARHVGRKMWYAYSCGVSILCDSCCRPREMWEELTDALPEILGVAEQ